MALGVVALTFILVFFGARNWGGKSESMKHLPNDVKLNQAMQHYAMSMRSSQQAHHQLLPIWEGYDVIGGMSDGSSTADQQAAGNPTASANDPSGIYNQPNLSHDDQQAWLTRAMGTRFFPEIEEAALAETIAETLVSNGSSFHPSTIPSTSNANSMIANAMMMQRSRHSEPKGSGVDRPLQPPSSLCGEECEPIYGIASEGDPLTMKPAKTKTRERLRREAAAKKGKKQKSKSNAAFNLELPSPAFTLDIVQARREHDAALSAADLWGDRSGHEHAIRSYASGAHFNAAADQDDFEVEVAVEVGYYEGETDTEKSESLYAEDFLMLKRAGNDTGKEKETEKEAETETGAETETETETEAETEAEDAGDGGAAEAEQTEEKDPSKAQRRHSIVDLQKVAAVMHVEEKKPDAITMKPPSPMAMKAEKEAEMERGLGTKSSGFQQGTSSGGPPAAGLRKPSKKLVRYAKGGLRRKASYT